MRATRAALHVVATALAPALLFSTPAFAAGSTATSTTVTATSETLGDELSEDDLRVAILRILADEDSGRAVVREANEALDDGTPKTLRSFLETGYRLARAEDDRVAVFRILANPAISDALRAAAEEAVDGAPEELRHFLEVGQYEVDG